MLAKELIEQVSSLQAKAEAAAGDYQKILSDLRVKGEQLMAREKEISELKETLSRLRRRLEALATDEPTRTAAPADTKFAAAKPEFAKMYHPNNNRFSGLEKLIRAELFKEFWEVLERIDTKVL